MAGSFRFEIATTEQRVFAGSATSVILPALEGYMGVWVGHALMLVSLQPGQISAVQASGETSYFAVSGGFARVSGDSVSVMADAAEPAGQIDAERAAAARDRALERIRHPSPDIDLERARAALARALTRLKVSRQASQA
jgi:F-type H+-transporting ATPase subunit epsilon